MEDLYNSFPDYECFVVDGFPHIYSKFYKRFLKIPKTGKNGYRQITVRNANGQQRTMNYARLAMVLLHPLPDYANMVVDHINRDKTDDRISNLRWVTQKENCSNKTVPHKYAHSKEDLILIQHLDTEEIEPYKKSMSIPQITVYSLANKLQGTDISKKYNIRCFYKKLDDIQWNMKS